MVNDKYKLLKTSIQVKLKYSIESKYKILMPVFFQHQWFRTFHF